MKKNQQISLVWKDKLLSEFMTAHGFVDSSELSFTEFKKLMFSVIESFLEKEISAENFADLGFRLWAPPADTDDSETEKLKDISYLLSELSYARNNTLEKHHPVITEQNKDDQNVYPYNGYVNEILRYYLDHK